MDGSTMPGPAAGGAGGGPTLRLSGRRFTAAMGLTETYTTNALGITNGIGIANAGGGNYSGGDFITRLTLSLGAHDHTARFDGDLEYTLAGDAYARHPSYDGVYNYLNALGTATLIPERLVVRGSAFAAPILINGLGAIGAGNRPVAAGANSGIRDTYGYTISPDLMFRLGNFARSETTLNQSSIFFVQPGGASLSQTIPGSTAPTELISYGASERLSSGIDFNRLNWALTAFAIKQTQSGADLSQATIRGDFRYAVSREVVFFTDLGYQSITSKQGLSQSVSGPSAFGGIQYTPSPNFEADASAGSQFNSPSYVGNLRYQFAAFTSLSASVTDTVSTPAGRLIGGLGQLGANAQGNFFNTNFQLNPTTPPGTVSGISAFNPAPPDGAAITPTIFRYRSAYVTLLHIADRTQYRLTAYRTVYDTLSTVPLGITLPGGSISVPVTIRSRGTSTGADLEISRNMTPHLTGSLDANYSVQDALGGQYRLFGVSLNFSYLMTPQMQTFLNAAYLHRDSNAALVAVSPFSGSLSDASIMIGISRQF